MLNASQDLTEPTPVRQSLVESQFVPGQIWYMSELDWILSSAKRERSLCASPKHVESLTSAYVDYGCTPSCIIFRSHPVLPVSMA